MVFATQGLCIVQHFLPCGKKSRPKVKPWYLCYLTKHGSAVQPWKWCLISTDYSTAAQASSVHYPRNRLWIRTYAANRHMQCPNQPH